VRIDSAAGSHECRYRIVLDLESFPSLFGLLTALRDLLLDQQGSEAVDREPENAISLKCDLVL
jgi:hypothetical protein